MTTELSIQSTKRMVTGYDIPVVGFGVYQTPPDVTEKVTLKALELGYRHIDSAKYYCNEAESASAICKSGLDRTQIFYTSKHITYEKVKQAIEESIVAADLGYIDLQEGRQAAWRALVEAQKTGKIRYLGVSNFSIRHLEELEAYIQSGIGGQIAVGQFEIHPWCPREELAAWLHQRNVVIEAYSPLVRATRMEEPVLQALAQKHGKTPAQVLLRWSLQKGYVPLPKSLVDARILENSQVSGFALSDDDMADLRFDSYAPVCWDPARTCE